MAELGKLMVEVFGSERLAILEALEAGPKRYSELSKTLRASEGELSRNLGRLSEAGLVAKQPDGGFCRTPLAATLLRHVPSLRFLADNADFVRTHAVHELPTSALATIQALGRAELRSDLFSIMEGIQDVFRGVTKRFHALWIIADTVWDEQQLRSQQALADRIEANDAEVRAVMLEEEVPLYNNLPAAALHRMQARILPRAPVSLAISDSSAFVSFNGNDGRLDNNYAFVGRDPAFVAWCEGLFEEAWSRATPHTAGFRPQPPAARAPPKALRR